MSRSHNNNVSLFLGIELAHCGATILTTHNISYFLNSPLRRERGSVGRLNCNQPASECPTPSTLLNSVAPV